MPKGAEVASAGFVISIFVSKVHFKIGFSQLNKSGYFFCLLVQLHEINDRLYQLMEILKSGLNVMKRLPVNILNVVSRVITLQ